MGLKDLFAGFTSRSSEKTLAKNITRLTNQNVQHEDRLHAAEILVEMNTEEALYGLLKRYDMTLDKGYMDLDEKTYVKELMVSQGDTAIVPIRRFLKDSPNVNWPERILSDILNDDEAVVTELLEVIESERDSGDMKGPKRAKLLSLLIKYDKDPRIPEKVVTFFDDFDESVRFAAIEVLDAQEAKEHLEKMVEVMTGPDEESGRVRMRILETIVRQGWNIGKWKPAIEAWLPDGYKLQGSKIVEVS